MFRNMLAPYLIDHMADIQAFKKKVADISGEDAFDKKFLTVLNSIISCFETNEAIKSLALNLLDEADFFSDTEIHKTTKSKYLDKILSDSDYIEHTKTFNLSVIQAYVEKIVHKQLYEINIKIEENQRSLNKLEVASGKMREEVQNQNQIQQTSQAQTAQLIRQPQSNIQHPSQIQTGQTEQSHQTQALDSLHPQPYNILQPQEIQIPLRSSFLLVEIDQQQCAITYSNIVEILKFDKPVSEKILKVSVIPHNKLVGFTRGSILRRVNDFHMDKKQSLNNMSATFPNREDKRFAVVINRDSAYHILFVDYIVYAEPVDGEEMGGDYVKTVEGEYKLING